MAGDERPTFLATPAASRAAAEVELGAAPGACSCGSGEEKKQFENDGGCAEVGWPPRLGAEAGAASRSQESSSSSTTALQESS
uniref:Uncharacterized protein n=1 Tax=Arundo donax TaxID=35708 RepID=A0A0A9AHI1_ARUDO